MVSMVSMVGLGPTVPGRTGSPECGEQWPSHLAQPDPLLLRRALACGKWTRGVVGPLLQAEGQSCLPGTAWPPRPRFHCSVAPAPGLRTWGLALLMHPLTSSSRAGPHLCRPCEGCMEEQTRGCSPGTSPVTAGLSHSVSTPDAASTRKRLWDLLFSGEN